MKNLGRFADVRLERNVQRQVRRNCHAFIRAEGQPVDGFHLLFVEVHVDHAFVRLNDAVLQPGGNVKFLHLNRQNQRRQQIRRDVYIIELHQRPHGCGDNGAGTRHADLSGDFGFVTNREVALVQRLAFGVTIFDKPFNRRFNQTHAAVVPVQNDVVNQVADGLKLALVFQTGNDFHLFPFVQRYLSVILRNAEGNRLAVIAVRRVPQQTGASVCFCFDYFHVDVVSCDALCAKVRRCNRRLILSGQNKLSQIFQRFQRVCPRLRTVNLFKLFQRQSDLLFRRLSSELHRVGSS